MTIESIQSIGDKIAERGKLSGLFIKIKMTTVLFMK
jgi:hypothetical protein